jgi:hypothetical protein
VGSPSTIGSNTVTAVGVPVAVPAGKVLNLSASNNYYLAMAGRCWRGSVNVTDGAVIAGHDFAPANTTVSNGAFLVGNPGASTTHNFGPLQLNGGIFQAQSGVSEFGNNAITSSAQTLLADRLTGRIFFTGGEFCSVLHAGDTDNGLRTRKSRSRSAGESHGSDGVPQRRRLHPVLQ